MANPRSLAAVVRLLLRGLAVNLLRLLLLLWWCIRALLHRSLHGLPWRYCHRLPRRSSAGRWSSSPRQVYRGTTAWGLRDSLPTRYHTRSGDAGVMTILPVSHIAHNISTPLPGHCRIESCALGSSTPLSSWSCSEATGRPFAIGLVRGGSLWGYSRITFRN